jgi:hypothetical protein
MQVKAKGQLGFRLKASILLILALLVGCGTARPWTQANSPWPEPPSWVVQEPSDEQLEDWALDLEPQEAVDSCILKNRAAVCPHGYPSWLVYFNLTE